MTWIERANEKIAKLQAAGLTPELALTRALMLGASITKFEGADNEHRHGSEWCASFPDGRTGGWLGTTPEMCAYRFLMQHHPHALKVQDTP